MGARKLNNKYNGTNKQELYDNYYTEGNAVRRVRPDSDIYENPLREERRRQSKRSSRKSQKELSSINMASCFFNICYNNYSIYLYWFY